MKLLCIRNLKKSVKSLLSVMLASASFAAFAAFPDRPVRMIVPFPAGGATDLMARTLAQELGTALGQQVLVDNRGGAGGTIGAEAAARAPADGYTVYFATMGTLALNPTLYSKLRYDPIKDFAPIAMTHLTSRVLVVGPSVTAKSIPELIAIAKSRPGTITYGSAGGGSTSHLSGALFASMAGVDMTHVPYKGSAHLLNDLMAGRVDLAIDSTSVYEEFTKTGRLRVLGVGGLKRIALLPKTPTISEAALPGYDVTNWLGLMAPSATPPDVLRVLRTALEKAMTSPTQRRLMEQAGIDTMFSTQEEFSQAIRVDQAKWAKVIHKAGLTTD